MENPYALVVAREQVQEGYVALLTRLGLPTEKYPRADAASHPLRPDAPAVAILEVEDGGCGMLRELRDRYGPTMPAVLISAERTTPADVVAGLLVGADDYAPESMDPDEFLARVRRLIERTRPAESATADLRRLDVLSPREREVLALTARGLSQKQVASELGISIKTVGAHTQNMVGKLGVHSRLQAVALSVRADATATP